MEKPAIHGGEKVNNEPFPMWPSFEDSTIEKAMEPLKSGKVNYWTGEVGKKFEEEWADAKGEKFDILGSLFYGIFLVLLIYGASRMPDVSAIWMMILGVLCMIAFFRWEKRVSNPVFDVIFFIKNRIFAFSSLSVLISYASVSAVSFLLSLYLQYIKGLSPQIAGMVLLCQPVVQAIFSPFAGRLSDKIEPGYIASTGMAVTAFCLFLFIFIGSDTSITYIVTALLILGFGYAMFASPNSNAIMSSVEKQHYGIASGLIGTMRTVGMVLSLAFTTVLFAILIGRTEIMPANYPSLIKSAQTAFAIFATLCTIGIFFSLTRGRLRK